MWFLILLIAITIGKVGKILWNVDHTDRDVDSTEIENYLANKETYLWNSNSEIVEHYFDATPHSSIGTQE